MPYRITRDRPLEEEIRRIALEQIDDALEQLEADGRAARIHDARKSLKMLRALVRFVRRPLGRTAYAAQNRQLRDTGRRLSSIRDAHVVLAAIHELEDGLGRGDRPLVEAVKRALEAKQRSLHADTLPASVDAARSELQSFRCTVESWRLEVSIEQLVDALSRSYRAARRAYRAALAHGGDERLHEWRKRTKDLWYQLRLLRDLWPAMTEGWIKESHRLSDLLGDDHDMGVLTSEVRTHTKDSAALARVTGVIRSRRSELQRRACASGARVFAEKPRHFRKRLVKYAQACEAELDAVPSGETDARH